MNELPDLTESELIILQELREKYPRQFFSNRNEFFVGEMHKYIKQLQVWRVSIMGETRAGKSETAQTICFKHKELFNIELKNPNYLKKIRSKIDKDIRVEPLNFSVENIMESQSEYLYKIRELGAKNELKFGQIWLIDENSERDGLGSWSEKNELNNINNIVAKFCQCEVWSTPRRMVEANAPYGLLMFKKDVINLCNWALLYKIDMTPEGIQYKFLGWLKIPLHSNVEHRKNYELKKSAWIKKVISGGADDRMVLRHKVATQLAEDELFAEIKLTSKGTKTFERSSKQQKSVLEDWIILGKCQNFNELEKEQIVSLAQDFAKRKWSEK